MRVIYPNGDYYEGDFCKNKCEGIGKYVQKNGKYYEGDWL